MEGKNTPIKVEMTEEGGADSVESPPSRRVSSPHGRSTVDVNTGELKWQPEEVTHCSLSRILVVKSEVGTTFWTRVVSGR